MNKVMQPCSLISQPNAFLNSFLFSVLQSLSYKILFSYFFSYFDSLKVSLFSDMLYFKKDRVLIRISAKQTLINS